MGPRLVCGLAICASLFLAISAQAREARREGAAAGKPRAATPPPGTALQQGGLSFRDGISAIIAKPTERRAWSDIDRSRVVEQFRLPDGTQAPQTTDAPVSTLIDMVRRQDSRRGLSFGIDGGSANIGPPVDAAARSAEVVAYQLAEASSCNGLMPGMSCDSIGGDDKGLRLALAYNF